MKNVHHAVKYARIAVIAAILEPSEYSAKNAREMIEAAFLKCQEVEDEVMNNIHPTLPDMIFDQILDLFQAVYMEIRYLRRQLGM